MYFIINHDCVRVGLGGTGGGGGGGGGGEWGGGGGGGLMQTNLYLTGTLWVINK